MVWIDAELVRVSAGRYTVTQTATRSRVQRIGKREDGVKAVEINRWACNPHDLRNGIDEMDLGF